MSDVPEVKESGKEKQIAYVATTRKEQIPAGYQYFCVDGTPPGWVPDDGDLRWDHHALGGLDVQLDELPMPPGMPLIEYLGSDRPPCILTTLVDADAVVAAAWLQIDRREADAVWALLPDGTLSKVDGLRADREVAALMGERVTALPDGSTLWSTKDLLRAIAFDCDHLSAPPDAKVLGKFASNVVIGLKAYRREIEGNIGQFRQFGAAFAPGDWVECDGEICQIAEVGEHHLIVKPESEPGSPDTRWIDLGGVAVGYPGDQAKLSDSQRAFYANVTFRLSTERLLRAIRGEEPFPGTLPGDAGVREYWAGVDRDVDTILSDGLLSFESVPGWDIEREIAVLDLRSIPRYVDPRALLKALVKAIAARNYLCGPGDGDESSAAEPEPPTDFEFEGSRLSPVTLTVKSRRSGGTSYTIGSIAAHPEWAALDLHASGVFLALSACEAASAAVSGNPGSFGAWNGRRTVGGSGFNVGSALDIPQVLEVVAKQLYSEEIPLPAGLIAAAPLLEKWEADGTADRVRTNIAKQAAGAEQAIARLEPLGVRGRITSSTAPVQYEGTLPGEPEETYQLYFRARGNCWRVEIHDDDGYEWNQCGTYGIGFDASWMPHSVAYELIATAVEKWRQETGKGSTGEPETSE